MACQDSPSPRAAAMVSRSLVWDWSAFSDALRIAAGQSVTCQEYVDASRYVNHLLTASVVTVTKPRQAAPPCPAAASATARISRAATAVYRCVVATDACPRASWTARRFPVPA